MLRTRPPSIVIQLANIVMNGLTEHDLQTLTANDARLLASRLDYWATQCFNHANQRQPQSET